MPGDDLIPASFPPPGWVTSAEVARMLGISPATFKSGHARWRVPGGTAVRRGRGQCKIYPIEQVEQFKAARAAEDARGPRIPEGFVDRAGACRMFGVTPRQWKHWITRGEVRCGVIIPNRAGGRCTIYPIDALKKLRQELFSRDTLYNYARGNFQVPAGWSRRHEACRMLGVDRATWDGWERDGLLPGGQRFEDGPTLYRIEDLKQVLQRAGRLAPSYPDPDGSGAVRVPLHGRDACGREAIIDAESVPLLDGKILTWGRAHGGEGTFVALCCPDKPQGVPLRRVILGITDDEMHVGHVNANRLDCRRANLFVRTIAQRTYGSRKMRAMAGRPCSSRFKGVCFESQTKKWRAVIRKDGITRRLGRFRDEIAAAQAYDEAARELFGAYAWLNFPDGTPDAWLERPAA